MLPLQCTGCGAFSQTTDSNLAGFFDTNRKAVRTFLGLDHGRIERSRRDEDRALEEALKSVDPEALKEIGMDAKMLGYGEVIGSEASGRDRTRGTNLSDLSS
jgi:hypothetical protein